MSLRATGSIRATYATCNGSTDPTHEGAVYFLNPDKSLAALNKASTYYTINGVYFDLARCGSSFGNYVRPYSTSCKFYIKY